MSFILDALKKSEREREQLAQNPQPGVIYRRAPAQPVWMFVVISLLLVNMILVLVMWLRNDHQQATPMITVNNAAPATSVPTPAPAVTSAPVSNTALPSLQDQAQPQDQTAAILANAEPPAGPPMVQRIDPDDAQKSGVAPATNNYSKNAGTTIPTLDSIGGAAALNLPAMHLDIHVYSINAADRFVFINMKKYSEGQTLKEGPVVEHIVPDGAVLKYGNQEFLLPRQ